MTYKLSKHYCGIYVLIEKTSVMIKKIETGKSEISILALIAIWSVSAITSLPGLAISPIMGSLETVFPHATDLEIQMLTSLPSMLVIPFLFLSGKLSDSKDKIKILYVGLLIFLLSGICYFFVETMTALIVLSCILGIGAGIVIPLSTGLIAEYFSGRYRTQQLGISSGINNLTLVIATYLTGWLAAINWHAPFAVYLLPVISVILCSFLPKPSPNSNNVSSKSKTVVLPQALNKRELLKLMTLYFFVTYCVLAIPLNLPFLMQKYNMDSESSGAVIAIFFLAITIPGFFITRILDIMRNHVEWINMLIMGIGLIIIFMSHHLVLFILGAALAGWGYGVVQPIIYDRTTKISPPRNVIMTLACVMSMNYLSVLITPFIIKFFDWIFSDNNTDFIFLINGILLIIGLFFTIEKRHKIKN